MIVQELWKVSFGKKSFDSDPWIEIEEAWGGADGDYVLDQRKDVLSVIVAVERKDCVTKKEKKEVAFTKALVIAAWSILNTIGQDVWWFRTLRDLAETGLEAVE